MNKTVLTRISALVRFLGKKQEGRVFHLECKYFTYPPTHDVQETLSAIEIALNFSYGLLIAVN